MSIHALKVPFCCIIHLKVSLFFGFSPFSLEIIFISSITFLVLSSLVLFGCNCLFVLFPTTWESWNCYICDTECSQIVLLFSFLFWYYHIITSVGMWCGAYLKFFCILILRYEKFLFSIDAYSTLADSACWKVKSFMFFICRLSHFLSLF